MSKSQSYVVTEDADTREESGMTGASYDVGLHAIICVRAISSLIFARGHMYALGRFIFHRTQLFMLSGAKPVPWDVNNKTMSLFFHKRNCFFRFAHKS